MKRSRCVIVNYGFDSKKWLSPLFHKIDEFHNWNQITSKTVVVLEGGQDIHPRLYSETYGWYTQYANNHRDALEQKVFKTAIARGAGILGICRGAQLICALSGGSLFQHVNGHHSSHRILTSEGIPMLATSSHHQMLNLTSLVEHEDYEMLAWAEDSDGLPLSGQYLGADDITSIVPPVEPEAVFFPKTNALAIQGHPEWAFGMPAYLAYCRDLVKTYLSTKGDE